MKCRSRAFSTAWPAACALSAALCVASAVPAPQPSGLDAAATETSSPTVSVETALKRRLATTTPGPSAPTSPPTPTPVVVPTLAPSLAPTTPPTSPPTTPATVAPTSTPTPAPIAYPTAAPTPQPTPAPTPPQGSQPTQPPTNTTAPSGSSTATSTASPASSSTTPPAASSTGPPTNTTAPSGPSTATSTTSPAASSTSPPAASSTGLPAAPTSVPTAAPTDNATSAPTAKPTSEPTAAPTAEPTTEPTASQTLQPTSAPTAEPTTEPTPSQTLQPTPAPIAEPTTEPTASQTLQPTAAPTFVPTALQTFAPTARPTPVPTPVPTLPTAAPTSRPTSAPTSAPPPVTSTPAPTAQPTVAPTADDATTAPTAEATATPLSTAAPTPTPTALPTVSAEMEAAMTEDELESMKLLQEAKQMEANAAIDSLGILSQTAPNDTTPVVLTDDHNAVVVVARRLLLDDTLTEGEGGEAVAGQVVVSSPGSAVRVALPVEAVAHALTTAALDGHSDLSDVAVVIAVSKDTVTSNATATDRNEPKEKNVRLNMGIQGNGVRSVGPVSVSMYQGTEKLHINNLVAPIKIVMSPPSYTNRGNGHQVCVYYDESMSAWSRDGVNFTVGEDGEVSCLTAHLTIFAVVDLLEEVVEQVLSCVRAELFTAESVKNIAKMNWMLKPPATLVWFAGLLHLVLLVQAVRKDRQYAAAPLPCDADLLTRDERYAKHESLLQTISTKLSEIADCCALFRTQGLAGICKLSVCGFASNAILRSAAAQARLCERSVQLMSEHWKNFADKEPLGLEGGADASESHVSMGISSKIEDTLQYIDSFSAKMTAVIKTAGAGRSTITAEIRDLAMMPQHIKQSASSYVFVAFFMASEPACRATRYSWTSTSWTRMMGRTVYFTGALAFQALTFQFDGSAQQEDADPRCSQKTLLDKLRIGALYAAISFVLSSLPASILEASWERRFEYFPSDRPEEDFLRARMALAQKWAFKDRVLSTVSCVYLAFCWFVNVSCAANVDTKGGMEDLFFSIAWSLVTVFVLSPLVLASAYLIVLVIVRGWKGGELLEQAVMQARDKLNRSTGSDADRRPSVSRDELQAPTLSWKDETVGARRIPSAFRKDLPTLLGATELGEEVLGGDSRAKSHKDDIFQCGVVLSEQDAFVVLRPTCSARC
eukprot:TRINITY_DN4876_c0_g1_i12.p1 TRINITY_DN4876_c0_g1~~TRINITY_DN4876_c0_g1_i12.p1  ORF type:complete len:1165 (+),score=149.13 TRINITY_DN4876_c0_g1_i12:59-3553(+)